MNYSEFLSATLDVKLLSEEYIKTLFSHFDTDGSGEITPENIREAMFSGGQRLSDEELDSIMK